MNCKKCGYSLTSLEQSCPNCGEPNEFYTEQTVINQTPPVEPAPAVEPEPAPIPEAFTEPVNPAPAVEPTTPAPKPAPVTPSVTPSVGINQAPISPIEKPKKNTGFVVLIIILLLIIAGLGTFIAIKLLGNDNGSSSGGSGGNSGGNSQGVEPVQPSNVDTNKTITIDGVEFSIPKSYTKKILNGYNTFVDSTNGVMFYVKGITNRYSYEDFKLSMKQNEQTIKTNLENSGAVYTGISDYTVNGHPYNLASGKINGVVSDVYITTILNNYVVVGEIVYTESGKDLAYKSLDTFLNGGKISNASSFDPTFTKDDIALDIYAYTKVE